MSLLEQFERKISCWSAGVLFIYQFLHFEPAHLEDNLKFLYTVLQKTQLKLNLKVDLRQIISRRTLKRLYCERIQVQFLENIWLLSEGMKNSRTKTIRNYPSSETEWKYLNILSRFSAPYSKPFLAIQFCDKEKDHIGLWKSKCDRNKNILLNNLIQRFNKCFKLGKTLELSKLGKNSPVIFIRNQSFFYWLEKLLYIFVRNWVKFLKGEILRMFPSPSKFWGVTSQVCPSK